MTSRLTRSHELLTIALIALSGFSTGCGNSTQHPHPDPKANLSLSHQHEQAGETCFICDASQRDPGRLWCKEHGRYEDRCWLCHPELREEGRIYCEEHGLYEDECFLCDPSRDQAAITPRVEPTEGLFCNEHRVSEDVCAICHPQLAQDLAVGDAILVRLASDRSAELAGLVTVTPGQADSSNRLSLLGEVRFNANRHAKVTPRIDGLIREVRADLGDTVQKGEVLAVIDAADFASARAAYMTAQAEFKLRRAAFDRQQGLYEDHVGSQRAAEEAQAALEKAATTMKLTEQTLLNLGLSPEEVAEVDHARSDFLLRAPFTGTVVQRSAVLGESVEAETALFEIANLEEVWISISVPEEQAARLGNGTPIHISARGHRAMLAEGLITWVAPMVDARTRMVAARGVVGNPDRLLRHGMFVDVEAFVDRFPGAMRLPSSSISTIEDHPFVFVQREADLFAATRVEVGDRLPTGETVVFQGLRSDDAVVFNGGFVVKSAMLAARLGAGCVDH